MWKFCLLKPKYKSKPKIVFKLKHDIQSDKLSKSFKIFTEVLVFLFTFDTFDCSNTFLIVSIKFKPNVSLLHICHIFRKFMFNLLTDDVILRKRCSESKALKSKGINKV